MLDASKALTCHLFMKQLSAHLKPVNKVIFSRG